LPWNYSKDLKNLVDKLLIFDLNKRPTINKVLCQPIIRAELNNILTDLLRLTYEYSTSNGAHKILEQIVNIQCEITTEYGLEMIDESLLRVANTPDTRFLLQAELKAIKQGL
jgi:hypothetical protein